MPGMPSLFLDELKSSKTFGKLKWIESEPKCLPSQTSGILLLQVKLAWSKIQFKERFKLLISKLLISFLYRTPTVPKSPIVAKSSVNSLRLNVPSNFTLFAIINQMPKFNVRTAIKLLSTILIWKCICFITMERRILRARFATANITSLHILNATFKMFT